LTLRRAVGTGLPPLVLLLVASCFSDGPADGVYACAPLPTQCPPGFQCETDQRCRRAPPIDASVPPTGDMSLCKSGALDGDESDVDCGGSCPGCEVGRLCKVDADCATGTCTVEHCDLTTSPPFWRALTSSTDERQKPLVVATPDGLIFAIGGADRTGNITNLVEAYSLATGKWSPFATLGLSRSSPAGGFVAKKLYVAGGFGNETQLEVYDTTAAKWLLSTNDIGFQIDQAGFVVAQDKLFVFGGLIKPSTITGDARSFVPGGWTQLANIMPRRALAGATVGGRIYAIGGNNGTQALDVVQSYSMNSPTSWTTEPSLPNPTEGLAAAGAPDGRIYAIGGAVAGAPVSTVVAYTPGSGRWTPVASLQNPRKTLGAATGMDGRIYAVGGASADLGALRDLEAYGPVVQLAPASVPVGGMVSVTGSNFAANAVVSVYAGATATGPALKTATTDATGVMPTLTLQVDAPAGLRFFTFVDHRSRYPVTLLLSVTP
jgi:hypothetical protein